MLPKLVELVLRRSHCVCHQSLKSRRCACPTCMRHARCQPRSTRGSTRVELANAGLWKARCVFNNAAEIFNEIALHFPSDESLQHISVATLLCYVKDPLMGTPSCAALKMIERPLQEVQAEKLPPLHAQAWSVLAIWLAWHSGALLDLQQSAAPFLREGWARVQASHASQNETNAKRVASGELRGDMRRH